MSKKERIEDLEKKVADLEKRVTDQEKKPPVLLPLPYPMPYPVPYVPPAIYPVNPWVNLDWTYWPTITTPNTNPVRNWQQVSCASN